MKKYLLFAFIVLCLVYACSSKEYDIRIVFTNPNGKAVKYSGYYRLESMEDTVRTDGYTPGEYTLVMDEDDVLRGAYTKDTLDSVDTLHFEVYVDAVPEINVFTTGAFDGGEYEFPAIGGN